jgi:hypothetical protein
LRGRRRRKDGQGGKGERRYRQAKRHLLAI